MDDSLNEEQHTAKSSQEKETMMFSTTGAQVASTSGNFKVLKGTEVDKRESVTASPNNKDKIATELAFNT